MDIGSNDGILLRPFKKLGVRVLGIDPARKIAKEASKNGLETLPEYFDQKLADYIIKKYGFADVICANNVFAHVPLIDELVLAIKKGKNAEEIIKIILFTFIFDIDDPIILLETCQGFSMFYNFSSA